MATFSVAVDALHEVQRRRAAVGPSAPQWRSRVFVSAALNRRYVVRGARANSGGHRHKPPSRRPSWRLPDGARDGRGMANRPSKRSPRATLRPPAMVEGSERVPRLSDLITSQMPGILRWVSPGCGIRARSWGLSALNPCERVSASDRFCAIDQTDHDSTGIPDSTRGSENEANR